MAKTFPEDDEPAHDSSSTARALEELALYNRTPAGEIDPRPLPNGDQVECAMAAIFETLTGIFQDTCLEPDLDATLWSFTELFHKLAAKAQRQLDENKTGRSVRRRNKTAPKSDRSNSRRSSPKAKPSSIATRPSNISAILPPPTMKPKPAPPGGPAPAASSAIAP